MNAKIIGRMLPSLGSLPEAREDRGHRNRERSRRGVEVRESFRSRHRPFSGQVAEAFRPGSRILACGVIRCERVHGFAFLEACALSSSSVVTAPGRRRKGRHRIAADGTDYPRRLAQRSVARMDRRRSE